MSGGWCGHHHGHSHSHLLRKLATLIWLRRVLAFLLIAAALWALLAAAVGLELHCAGMP